MSRLKVAFYGLVLAGFFERTAYYSFHSVLIVFLMENPELHSNGDIQVSQFYQITKWIALLLPIVGAFWSDRIRNSLLPVYSGLLLAILGILLASGMSNPWLSLLGVLFVSIGSSLQKFALVGTIFKASGQFGFEFRLFYGIYYLTVIVGSAMASFAGYAVAQTDDVHDVRPVLWISVGHYLIAVILCIIAHKLLKNNAYADVKQSNTLNTRIAPEFKFWVIAGLALYFTNWMLPDNLSSVGRDELNRSIINAIIYCVIMLLSIPVIFKSSVKTTLLIYVGMIVLSFAGLFVSGYGESGQPWGIPIFLSASLIYEPLLVVNLMMFAPKKWPATTIAGYFLLLALTGKLLGWLVGFLPDGLWAFRVSSISLTFVVAVWIYLKLRKPNALTSY